MKKYKIILRIVIMLAAFGARAEVLSLEQCVDSALARNPEVAAAALEMERSRILKATAFDPPMTEVTLKQETTGGGGPENGVYFGQEFAFPTLYVARYRLLQAQHELAGGRFDLLVRDVRREVATAYYSLMHSAEVLHLNTELGAVYDEFCRVAEVRLNEGEAGRLELMNARRVRERNALERQSEEAACRQLQIDLQRLTGCTVDPTPAVQSQMILRPRPIDVGVYESPETQIAALELNVAERELTVARHELLPGIRIGATVQALIRSFNPYHVERLPFEKGNFMGFEVGVTLPVFFGAQSARVKAADVNRRIAYLNVETQQSLLKAEVDKQETELASLASQLDYYENTSLPQAQEIKRIASVSYELGDIDYLEYIANMETAYSVFREYVDLKLNYNLCLLKRP